MSNFRNLPPEPNPSSAATMTKPVVAATVAVFTTAMLSYCYHHSIVRKIEADYKSKRQAERTGRIRAEVKLRSLQKHQHHLPSSENGTHHSSQQHGSMVLKCIGTVQSPFTKRMGTPRQGALVPSSRGCVKLDSDVVPMEALSNLDEYSHAWILFGFHANTDLETSRKTKVKPPRAGGIKVGALATRSPHRPNAIGLSLVRVERLEHKMRELHISALDLVHGTPVYDIKPCVPWDIPGHYDHLPLSVPEWVSQEDELPEVHFTEDADEALERAVAEKHVGWPLYSSINDGHVAARTTIRQVLAQDPRAANRRGSVTKPSESSYKIIFGSIQVEFVVKTPGSVTVVGISLIEFPDSAYVDGIPLSSEAN